MKNYIIIPGSSDLNRGDQALAWETKEIAKDAGFVGRYSILAESEEPDQQSRDEGYNILTPVLEHPSRYFKSKDNINYTKFIKLLWGIVAVKDTLYSLLCLTRFGRTIFYNLFPNSKHNETIKAFRNADAIFMKGGGLIQSHGGLLSTYATYYRLYHIMLAQSLKKPVYIMPNSLGPFEGPFVKRIVKNTLEKCEFVSVREEKSKQVVSEVLNINLDVFPDLAFFLKKSNESRGFFFDKYSIPKEKKNVAITMRPYRFPNSKDPIKAYNVFKKELALTIESIYKLGMIPILIEHTHAITSHENDGDTISDVLELLPEDVNYVFISDKTLNCRQLKNLYSCCDYIIGTRFHSLIFSLSEHVPGLAISYDGYKSIGIMADMGLEDYVIDIADVTEHKLIKMLKKVINDEESVIENIDKYIIQSQKRRNELVKLINRGD
ncbi:polysaccharide pyruvyl transferase family protein [Enterococcus avium]|uniref:polysaccharide pyruvyl transferase family protein n=1 Tax=Enterococcus avium TaxID=33945 RepID=UPI002891C031|nr:polysaccharide pyruvyl transferase family protein [Enterococcus avium]MDT2459460.1 polysaccharide pyruvyl transferase family protein [Enterococcus avium]